MTYESYLRWRTTPVHGTPDLSVVIPAYNEAARIVPTIAAVAAHVSDLVPSWELVVVDDGSTDATVATVEGLDLANCRVVRSDRNRGKGDAVRSGIRSATGRLVLFTDADLSTPIEELDRLLAAIERGADVAVGSRGTGEGADQHRSALRRSMSAVLRTLVRVVFPVGLTDSQCGFKLFTADAAARLVEAQTIEGFSFDLELLWVAHRLGMTIEEVPVEWIEAPGSKVDPARESLRFLLDMGRIRHRHRGSVARRTFVGSEGLRLGVVSPYPPSPQTLNEYGYHLVRELAAKPDVDEVVLLCDDEAADARCDGVRVVPSWRFDSLRSPLRILAAVRRQRPDVVLFNIQFASFGSRKVPAALGLLTPALLRLAGVPTVVLLHNLVDTVDLEKAGFTSAPAVARLLSGIGRVLTRLVLRAERVAVTIPGYVDLLHERYGADNVYLAPHGSFGTAEKGPTTVPDRPRLLTFGKFGTYKRIEDLVESYRRLLDEGHDDLELVVAGTDSPNSPGYLASVAAANTDLRGLTFTGYVPEEEVEDLFRSATLVVFPYTGTTGSSGPLHQAGQHGRAVVLPAIGDFVAVIEEEGFTGETFVPGDVASLADAVRRLLTDDDRRLEIAERNAQAAAGLPIGAVADLHLLHCVGLLPAA